MPGLATPPARGVAPGVQRYDIAYRTMIHYDDVVRGSQNELRACPLSDSYQQLIAYRVATHPAARVFSYHDYWGTRADTFGVREPHVSLEINAEATVETVPRPLVTVSPRLATTRSVSSAMTSDLGRAVARPSALLTTLLVRTTTSPSCSRTCLRTRSARSVPASTSPTPSMAITSKLMDGPVPAQG